MLKEKSSSLSFLRDPKETKKDKERVGIRDEG
jgi:hypothetical protein